MITMKKRAALVALVLTAVGSLSACGGNPIKNAVDDAVGNAVDQGTEKVIEQAAGGDADIDIDLDGDGASLPGSFPDSIPRPDGKLIMAVAADDGWQLAYQPADASAVESIVAEFGSWTMQAETDYGEWKSWQFVNDDYLVLLSAIQDDDGWSISMIVATVTE